MSKDSKNGKLLDSVHPFALKTDTPAISLELVHKHSLNQETLNVRYYLMFVPMPQPQ